MSPGVALSNHYDRRMRTPFVLLLSVLVFVYGISLANATTVQKDLPGDRADIVARELMSPF